MYHFYIILKDFEGKRLQNIFFSFSHTTENWTKGLVHAIQVFYHVAIPCKNLLIEQIASLCQQKSENLREDLG